MELFNKSLRKKIKYKVIEVKKEKGKIEKKEIK